jgi:hypothetical protein
VNLCCRSALCLALLGGLAMTMPADAATPAPKKTFRKASTLTDTLQLGNPRSEQAHGLMSSLSDMVVGGLGQPARRLLPRSPVTWQGGTLAFTLKVDPNRPNYVTVRLWGSDMNENRLKLFCEGKQVGYHHLGDVDLLDFGTDGDAPGYSGRFFYNTSPLPLALTRGKTELHFEVRCIGRIWGYGTTFAQYQKPMETPTRGIYALYSHTDGYFAPPAAEKQGEAPAHPPVRQTPGPEVLEQVKARVNAEIDSQLRHGTPLNQMQMQFLARAYHIPWTHAYHNDQVIKQVVRGLDALYAAYTLNPKLAESEPSTYNPDWFGLGPAGDVIRLLAAPLRPVLNEPIPDHSEAPTPHWAAWSEMLRASRDWHRRNRRQYTNQSMIVDMYIYSANSGVAAIDPAHALPEEQTRHYLYQSIGLEPWLGSDTDSGPAKPLGDHYYELTQKGLTRELGYVGYYGEVPDWVAQIYDVTRSAPDQPGDPKIKAQMEKILHARAVFRHPALDADGNRAMRIETIVGWRDAHYPGDVVYAERPSWDGTALYVPAATLDPQSLGYVQQMFADNQFFASLQSSMKERSLRVNAGLMGAPDQYALLKAQSPVAMRLPMTPGQPDFVFSDEEDGVVAIKHGDEILYASLYWRARYAINNLARIHYITPRFDRIAVVRQETQFTPSGLTYTVPDWIDQGFSWNSHDYPKDLHQALAGEQQPIAKIPAGVPFKVGDENSFAGKGEFYVCRYGDYLIGMNCTPDKTFPLPAPPGFARAAELVSGKTVSLTQGALTVKPMSTVVLYLGSSQNRRAKTGSTVAANPILP